MKGANVMGENVETILEEVCEICLSERGVRDILKSFKDGVLCLTGINHFEITKVEWCGEEIPHSAFKLDIILDWDRYQICYFMDTIKANIGNKPEMERKITELKQKTLADLDKLVLSLRTR